MLQAFRRVPRHEAVAASLAVGIGVLLLVIKFVAYYLTGSAAIFSDALESIVNVLASLFAAYSLFLAHQPPDKDHPYGHGKIEFLSAGFEGGMILLAAFVIAGKAIDAILHRAAPENADAGVVLMGVAMFVNGGLGFYLIHIGRKRKSITLEADGHHLVTDAVTSVAVIIALLLIRFTGWSLADPITALLVAVYLVYTSQHLLRRSASGLMDQQDTADEALLTKLLDAHTSPATAAGSLAKPPRICSYHKLRHRHTGRYHWIDFHLVVPASWTITQGHEVASALEHEIETALGEGDATAHIEPCTDAKCPHCAAVIASPIPSVGG